MGRLDGKVAVITGGASGIGEATAKLFIEEGAYVVITDIQDKKGRHLSEELGQKAIYLHVDVAQEAEVKAAIKYAQDTYGHLDCIFNNAAAAGVGGPIDMIPVEAFDYTTAVILRGVFLGMKHAASVMKHQGTGSIINTSSVAALRGFHTGYSYSAAKAAVIQLTRAAAVELGRYGVRVNCICPGWIATPIFGREWGLSQEEAEQSLERIKPILAKEQPIQRAGLPEDVAQAALWLASNDSSFVTGHALVVDGGVSAGLQWTGQLSRTIASLQQALGLDT